MCVMCDVQQSSPLFQPNQGAMRRTTCSVGSLITYFTLTRAITLPSVPYNLPESPSFDAERAGGASSKFLTQLPKLKAAIRDSVYLSSKDALWGAPAHEAIEEIVTHMAYHDVARYVMEHNWFHLFGYMLLARDAPLPHVVYEDFMKCKTFASLQCPPEEQFALEPAMLRSLLCCTSHAILQDEHYFESAEALFRTIEQQQRVGAEVLSAWTLCLTAAGKIRRALKTVMQMETNGLRFDPVVFALMLHPHADPSAVQGSSSLLHGGKGFILQQRLQNRMGTAYGAATIAVHAMFTHYVLTMQHTMKWDVLRHAVELDIELSDRTLVLALEVFSKERGMRCGPKTMRALVRALASHGRATDLVFVMYSCRRNELLPEFCDLPPVEFDDEEIAFVMRKLRDHSSEDRKCAVVAPLVSVLMAESDPVKLEDTIQGVLRHDDLTLRRPAPSLERGSAPQMEAQPPKGDATDSATPSTAVIGEAESPETLNKQAVSESSELVELLRTAVIPRARRRKVKRGHKRAPSPTQPSHPTADDTLIVGSAIEGRTTSEKLNSDFYSDAKALHVASIVHELEQQRDSERLSRASTAWINPDF